MKIDIKRLETDLDYWNSVAPSKAEYYDPANGKWMLVKSGLWYMSEGCDSEWFGPILNYNPIPRDVSAYIEKPRQVLNAGWDGAGLPQISTVCEFRYRGQEWEGRSCKVLGFDPENDMCWLHLDGNEKSNLYALDVFEFKPLRTKEQIEREETINEALEIFESYKGYTANVILEELYNAGLLRRNNK